MRCKPRHPRLVKPDGMLAGFQDDIDTVRTDLVALGTANTLQDLLGEDGLNPEKDCGFHAADRAADRRAVLG